MSVLKQKATSERGASITFALLLFLVCAIISSVVIVAATAVGGRASKMAEMDQRYYAVNSAAELIRDVMEEPEVTVEVKKTTPSKVLRVNTPSGTTESEISHGDTNIDPAQIFVDGNKADDTSLLTAASLIVLDESDTTITQAMNNADFVFPPSLPTVNLTATTTSSFDTSGLSVTLKPIANPDKSMSIYVSNTNSTQGVYSLCLTFKASAVQSSDSQTFYDTQEPYRDPNNGNTIPGQYTMMKTDIETTKTTVQWKLIDLKTGMEPASTTNPGGA